MYLNIYKCYCWCLKQHKKTDSFINVSVYKGKFAFCANTVGKGDQVGWGEAGDLNPAQPKAL